MELSSTLSRSQYLTRTPDSPPARPPFGVTIPGSLFQTLDTETDVATFDQVCLAEDAEDTSPRPVEGHPTERRLASLFDPATLGAVEDLLNMPKSAAFERGMSRLFKGVKDGASSMFSGQTVQLHPSHPNANNQQASEQETEAEAETEADAEAKTAVEPETKPAPISETKTETKPEPTPVPEETLAATADDTLLSKEQNKQKEQEEQHGQTEQEIQNTEANERHQASSTLLDLGNEASVPIVESETAAVDSGVNVETTFVPDNVFPQHLISDNMFPQDSIPDNMFPQHFVQDDHHAIFAQDHSIIPQNHTIFPNFDVAPKDPTDLTRNDTSVANYGDAAPVANLHHSGLQLSGETLPVPPPPFKRPPGSDLLILHSARDSTLKDHTHPPAFPTPVPEDQEPIHFAEEVATPWTGPLEDNHEPTGAASVTSPTVGTHFGHVDPSQEMDMTASVSAALPVPIQPGMFSPPFEVGVEETLQGPSIPLEENLFLGPPPEPMEGYFGQTVPTIPRPALISGISTHESYDAIANHDAPGQGISIHINANPRSEGNPLETPVPVLSQEYPPLSPSTVSNPPSSNERTTMHGGDSSFQSFGQLSPTFIPREMGSPLLMESKRPVLRRQYSGSESVSSDRGIMSPNLHSGSDKKERLLRKAKEVMERRLHGRTSPLIPSAALEYTATGQRYKESARSNVGGSQRSSLTPSMYDEYVLTETVKAGQQYPVEHSLPPLPPPVVEPPTVVYAQPEPLAPVDSTMLETLRQEVETLRSELARRDAAGAGSSVPGYEQVTRQLMEENQQLKEELRQSREAQERDQKMLAAAQQASEEVYMLRHLVKTQYEEIQRLESTNKELSQTSADGATWI
ncbi:hypothetical protein BGW38_005227 [Lunasporangiospora selenospora]|uniref:Uncharacterized protein n=1 Tax=Lunasporangiospora selenospora TaxID=979761 RepID=A0A9P6FP11_9FUNG|nr:hypothetical protein BGW38_005227 [Lunasporangiospora selenospora]